METIIRKLEISDISGLNSLPPFDWNFNYEFFLTDFINEDYFYAFLMVYEDKIIGTGNVFLKDKIGWLANIIVLEKFRRKGFGFEMTKFLVDFLISKGCETQLLIATELGEPVYKKLGFKSVSVYHRFDSEIDFDYNCSDSIRDLNKCDLKEIYELDISSNGEDRKHLINKFYQNGVGYFRNNKLQGLYLPDFGRGLVLSKEKNAGIELLKFKHSKKGRISSLPIENKDGLDYFNKSGIKKGYKCSRMILGKEIDWNPENIYSYGGGYFG